MSQLNIETFRKLVRELIQQEIDEASTTSSAGGQYNTPHAFKGTNKKGTKKGKAGYEGGHEDPTIGTDNFEPKDPKLRKEWAVNEAVNSKDVEYFVKKKGLKGMDLPFWKVGIDYPFYPTKYHHIRAASAKDAEKQLSTMYNRASGGKIRKAKFDDDRFLKVHKNLKESVNEGRYHAWRNDDSLTPKQKIGMAMRETRDNLTELERVVRYNVKLKNELNVDSRDYWKNTHKALSKISERLVRLANKVGQLH